VNKSTRPPIDQGQRCCHDGVVRRFKDERLNQRKAQHHTRLGIVGQALLSGAVNEIIKIGQAPQGF
jgi:hypothetical protein